MKQPTPPPAADPDAQLTRFRDAVALLGGPQRAARAIGANERTMQRWMAGSYAIHAPTLAAIGKALLAHAEACRSAERTLSPAFAANLTPEQHARPSDGRMLKPEF